VLGVTVEPRRADLDARVGANFVDERHDEVPSVRLGGRVAYRRKDLDQFVNDRVVSSVQDERRIPS
jgi:hypothetical protein